MTKNRNQWTSAELAVLYRGGVPSGRTRTAARMMAWRLGIFREGIRGRANHVWMKSDADKVKRHVVPKGLTYSQCRNFCRRNGISIVGEPWRYEDDPFVGLTRDEYDAMRAEIESLREECERLKNQSKGEDYGI